MRGGRKMTVDIKIEIDWHKKIKTGTIYVDGKFHSHPYSVEDIHKTIDEVTK